MAKLSLVLSLLIAAAAAASAQVPAAPPAVSATSAAAAANASLPSDYVIGPDDVLSIVFWRDRELSGDVAVRPDGRISLPLLNDVAAAGLTPEQLRDRLSEAATRFLEEATVSVIVKQVNSRKVFVTGYVARPGPYPLTAPTTVLQMIAIAGGLREDADGDHIAIMRNEGGRPVAFEFNYGDMSKRRKLAQNIELKPGDTIVVP